MLKARYEPTGEPLLLTYEEHSGPIKEGVISGPHPGRQPLASSFRPAAQRHVPQR
jgi:hypothetical protein